MGKDVNGILIKYLKKRHMPHLFTPTKVHCFTAHSSTATTLLSLHLRAVWLTWAVVCLLAAPRVQLFTGVGSEWPHSALWYH